MRKSVVIALLAFAAPLVQAPAALADVPGFTETQDQGKDACSAKQVCLYNLPGLNAERKDWVWTSRTSQPDLGRSPGASDEAESVYNRTDRWATLYEHYYYGRCVSVRPGGVVDDLDEYGLRNNVTSLRIDDEYGCPAAGYIPQ